jgi:hypothetical protein
MASCEAGKIGNGNIRLGDLLTAFDFEEEDRGIRFQISDQTDERRADLCRFGQDSTKCGLEKLR